MMRTDDILEFLHDLEGRPWPEYKNNKPITDSQLAKLLKDYGPRPKTRRYEDGNTRKGYALEEFQDAFERYLPSDAVTTSQPNNFNGSTLSEDVTRKSDVTRDSAPKPSENAVCDDVTAAEGPPPPEFKPGIAVPIPADPPINVEAMIRLDRWTEEQLLASEDKAALEPGENYGS